MKPISSVLLIASMIALFALAADPVFGQNAGGTGSDSADHVSSPFAGIEDFVDGVLSLQMHANDVAGATVAVVHGGDVVLSKGYGYADVDEQRVVDPVSTMFRIASITKLFTWTAVMQLVEKGELELDVDVQNYVDFVIPSAFGQPITLRDLMTHTAGFEDRAFAIASPGSAPSMPLGEWLATHIPARIWTPGDVVAYSNYGAALAGYIVERTTGMSYDDYVDRSLFEPLQMTSTTTRQPVRDRHMDQLATGYTHYKGRFYAKEFEVENTPPAGAGSSTAADMAKYMIALLQGGVFQDARIARPDTVARMLSQAFSYHEQTNGMALGFIEFDTNGHRAVGHDGDLLYFHSMMVILPEQDTGLFISYNSASSAGLPKELFRLFMDRYFPAPPLAEVAGSGDASRFAGSYDWSRANFTTTERLESLFSEVRFVATADGMLATANPASNMRMVQIEPLHFIDVNGGQTVTFVEDDRGAIAYAALSDWPDMVLIRQRWYQSDRFHLAVILAIAGVFGAGTIGALRSVFTNRRKDLVTPSLTRRPLVDRWGWAVHLVTAASLVALALGVKSLIDDYVGIMQGTVGLVLPRVASVTILASTAVALLATGAAWIKRSWRLTSRIGYTIVTTASVGLVWWMSYWNLLWVQF